MVWGADRGSRWLPGFAKRPSGLGSQEVAANGPVAAAASSPPETGTSSAARGCEPSSGRSSYRSTRARNKSAEKRWRRRRRGAERRDRGQRLRRLEHLEARQMMAVQVAEPLGQLFTQEDGHDEMIDLRQVFQSDLEQPLTFQIEGTGYDSLIEASIDQWALHLHPVADQVGMAELTVRATGQIDHEEAVDTLAVHVSGVNDWPELTDAIPELRLNEGETTTLDLTQYFADTELSVDELSYSARHFDDSNPEHPAATAAVQNGQLTVHASESGFGFSRFAIEVDDRKGGNVATTLNVYVNPINDPPVARQMPDRHYHFYENDLPPTIALDLWEQHRYDATPDHYFWDEEDAWFLDYSVTTTNREVFAVEPHIDENDFLVYRPTVAADFVGQATVTITATDRQGLEATLSNGKRSTFIVSVDNTLANLTGSSTATSDSEQSSPDSELSDAGGAALLGSSRATVNSEDLLSDPARPANSDVAVWDPINIESATSIYPAALYEPYDPPDVGPPLSLPPISIPPYLEPPIYQPPYFEPPVYDPPPSYQPPDEFPPIGFPPDEDPSDYIPDPSDEYPPDEEPPYDEPSYYEPPYYEPPYYEPPYYEPPYYEPPYYEPPYDEPPYDEPPYYEPPYYEPPYYEPPYYEPPSDYPPDDDPSDYIPPAEDPPISQPPIGEPPDDSEVPPSEPVPPPSNPYQPPVPVPGVPPQTPITPLPGEPLPEIVFGINVLENELPDHLKQSAGALVGLNNDFDEMNWAMTTTLMGPDQIPVATQTRIPDNDPIGFLPGADRPWIQAGAAMRWVNDSAGFNWIGAIDSDLRKAIVTTNVNGSVRFDFPENTQLWIPAAANLGYGAVPNSMEGLYRGTRWIPVRPGLEYASKNWGYTQDLFAIYSHSVLPVLIEGLEVGTGQIVATFSTANGRSEVADRLKVQVVSFDVDVDSDNNNGLALPDRSEDEELVEDLYLSTGKRITVNSDDEDQDGIPDFLDGFNLDGHRSSPFGDRQADDLTTIAAGSGFTPLEIELPSTIDVSRALLRFSYRASDPAAANLNENNLRQVASGGLRLWTVDQSQPRNPRAANATTDPGHFVAPTQLIGGEQSYSVAQLTGGGIADQITLYVEGIAAGDYAVSVELDPDGVPDWLDANQGEPALEYPDLVRGFAYRDTVQFHVASQVTVTAIDAIASEVDSNQQPDLACFLVSRSHADSIGELDVYYRVVTDAQSEHASDFTLDPSRADYQYFAGLADDPTTMIGRVRIPHGHSTAAIWVNPINDRAVEWDEQVSIELITWDEYRALHDEPFVVTPNNGIPSELPGQIPSSRRSAYQLETDEQGQPINHTASITLLDNDRFESHSYRQPDHDSSASTTERIGYGSLTVDVHGGHAHYAPSGFDVTYREDDNLYPIVETLFSLPAEAYAATDLKAVYTVAGYSGKEVTYDISGLDTYLASNPLRQLRLVVPGPVNLATKLATGRFDHDIRLTVEIDGRTVTRTLRGSTDIVNRVDEQLGSSEWGQRWSLEELDRLVPSDGISSGGTGPAVSRLGAIGATPHEGVSIVRGDNSMSWYASQPADSAQTLAVNSVSTQFTRPVNWQGYRQLGRNFRMTSAGMEGQSEEVTWCFDDLTPGKMIQVLVNWAPDAQMSSQAPYRVSANSVTGDNGPVLVDQRYAPAHTGVRGNPGAVSATIRLPTIRQLLRSVLPRNLPMARSSMDSCRQDRLCWWTIGNLRRQKILSPRFNGTAIRHTLN